MRRPVVSRLSIGLGAARSSRQRQPMRRWYATEAKGHDIEGMLEQKSFWESFPDSIRKLAVFAEHARANNYQIPLLSQAQRGAGEFDQSRAYHVAAAIRQLREMNGEVVAGRKLGFTNQRMWPEYGVTESNWSYVYQNTVVDLPEKGRLAEGEVVVANISHLSALEPKIEPELILGLKTPVDASMTDLELLRCIDWIAHGFEIATSIFPHWKFTAADATAGFALHGLVLVGPRMQLAKHDLLGESMLESLKTFHVELHRNTEKVDEGRGEHVLGSPICALRRLAELLAKDEHNKQLEAGELVATGTLTRALPIQHGDFWSTKISGIDLPGLDVSFRLE